LEEARIEASAIDGYSLLVLVDHGWAEHQNRGTWITLKDVEEVVGYESDGSSGDTDITFFFEDKREALAAAQRVIKAFVDQGNVSVEVVTVFEDWDEVTQHVNPL